MHARGRASAHLELVQDLFLIPLFAKGVYPLLERIGVRDAQTRGGAVRSTRLTLSLARTHSIR